MDYHPRCDDVVIIPTNQGGIPVEEYKFIRIKVTGYCLPDEFWGEDDNGKEYLFLDSDTYKIILKGNNTLTTLSNG